MSQYENYAETSANYDRTRVPVGVEIIVGCLAQNEVPLPGQHLLDAGCGTGNYSRAMLRHVNRISAVDLNPEMLAQAQRKLAPEQRAGRIEFHQGSIDALPLDNGSVDGIMINQVLHHLELAPEQDYPAYRRILAEFARVMKPGGQVIINTCSPQQLRQGFWYYHLFPHQTEAMCRRHAPLPLLRQLMEESGIEYRNCHVPMDSVMQGEAYFDPRGPLDSQWRHGDSIWSTVPESTITDIVARLSSLDAAGELEAYMRHHDQGRQLSGQFSFLHGQRT